MLIFRFPIKIVKTDYLKNLEDAAARCEKKLDDEMRGLQFKVHKIAQESIASIVCRVCGRMPAAGGIYGNPNVKKIKTSGNYCRECWRTTKAAHSKDEIEAKND